VTPRSKFSRCRVRSAHLKPQLQPRYSRQLQRLLRLPPLQQQRGRTTTVELEFNDASSTDIKTMRSELHVTRKQPRARQLHTLYEERWHGTPTSLSLCRCYPGRCGGPRQAWQCQAELLTSAAACSSRGRRCARGRCGGAVCRGRGGCGSRRSCRKHGTESGARDEPGTKEAL
jgi:hypothetical protein